MSTKNEPLYHIYFRDPKNNEMVFLRARKVEDSSLGLSFISISDFVWDNSTLVIKPTEDHLRKRLEGVRSLHLSIYSILSIEEMSAEKLSFKKDRSNLVSFPNPGPTTGH